MTLGNMRHLGVKRLVAHCLNIVDTRALSTCRNLPTLSKWSRATDYGVGTSICVRT